MKENYLIEIRSTQEVDGEREVLELTSRAALSGTGDDYVITYTDEDGDLAGTTTTLHVENGRRVTISRKGGYQSHMIIEERVRHISQHNTPYGSFMLGVSALQVQSDIQKNGGILHFRYCTDVDMVPLGEIDFQITLKEQNNGGSHAICN